jgi:hypothetical protein
VIYLPLSLEQLFLARSSKECNFTDSYLLAFYSLAELEYQ